MTLFKRPDSGLDRVCSTHGKVVVGVGPEGGNFRDFSAGIGLPLL